MILLFVQNIKPTLVLSVTDAIFTLYIDRLRSPIVYHGMRW